MTCYAEISGWIATHAPPGELLCSAAIRPAMVCRRAALSPLSLPPEPDDTEAVTGLSWLVPGVISAGLSAEAGSRAAGVDGPDGEDAAALFSLRAAMRAATLEPLEEGDDVPGEAADPAADVGLLASNIFARSRMELMFPDQCSINIQPAEYTQK